MCIRHGYRLSARAAMGMGMDVAHRAVVQTAQSVIATISVATVVVAVVVHLCFDPGGTMLTTKQHHSGIGYI
ncbi:unnamed protein product [Sphagnum balticum]